MKFRLTFVTSVVQIGDMLDGLRQGLARRV